MDNNTQSETYAADTYISASGSLTEAPGTTASEAADTTVPADTTASAASENSVKRAGLRYVPGTGTLSDEPDRMMPRKANNAGQIVGTLYNGQPVSSDFYYYRCMLNNNGKSAYDTIHAGLLTGADTIKLTTPLSESDVDIVYYSVLYDDPQIVWAEPGFDYTYNNSGNVVSISPMYNRLANDISGTKKALENSVSKALAAMWELPNNIERSKYAHDYLTHTIDYSEGELDQNAYSALVQHKTVCAGYSQAYAYMMQKMGAPCAVLIGYAGEGHAWNIVTLNGESYVTDVTWDDPYGNPPDTYYYDYFNITSAQMSRDHTLQSPSTYLAAATGTKASYYNYFGGNAYGTDFDGTNPVSYTTSVTTTAVTTNPPAGTTSDWDDWWDDDWWNYFGIDPNWSTTSSATNPPVTTTTPHATTTTPHATTTTPHATTTTPHATTTTPHATTTTPHATTTTPHANTTTAQVTTPYDWDSYWNDDWWDYYGIDINGDYNWDWDDSNEYWYENSSSSDWWNYLDPYWEKSDWTYEGDGLWSIEDPETGYLYMYDENDGTFYCMTDDDTVYWYDSEKNEWVEL
ncbi:MAG: hypothetical protein K5876_04415 [Ruminiclostridium sp.]|nr:hypothetical protein [Ruminiclostridium sp.]